MIQVDVFWSFGMGAMFAVLAHRQLKKEKHPFVNYWFMYAVLFLSVVFAPSGAYLLAGFPGWETMFFLQKYINPNYPLLPCLFSCTNTLMGVIGFYWAYSLIHKGQAVEAHSLWTTSYIIMMGILGFGYRRFLYPGTHVEWEAGITYPLVDWIGSKIFYTLIVMAFFVMPLLWYPLYKWPAQGGSSAKEKSREIKYIFKSVFVTISIGCIGFFIYLVVMGEQERNRLKDGPSGYYAPLIGYLCAQLAWIIIAIVPFTLSPTNSHKKHN